MSAANYTGGTPGPETAAEPSEGALRAAEGHSGGWQPGDKALIEVEVQGRPIAGCHFVWIDSHDPSTLGMGGGSWVRTERLLPLPEPPSADVIEVAALATDLRENRLHRALDDVVRNAFTSNIASAAREYVAEEDFDAMLDAIVEALGEGAAGLLTDPDAIRRAKAEALRALVSDWQANGNSRPLGDPTADVWQACAFQLLTVLDRIGGE